MLFGDNDTDRARDASRKPERDHRGGQAKPISEYDGVSPCDRTIAIGIVTTFKSKPRPDFEAFKQEMDKRFAVVQKLLRNGSDIILSTPNKHDLTGRFKHKYLDRTGARAIYHNLGTGIANLPFDYLEYIQMKVNELKKCAKRTAEIQSCKMYKGYGQIADSGRSPSLLHGQQPQQQRPQRRAPMQTTDSNNDRRAPPRTPQRNQRRRTPVNDRNIRGSPNQITVVGDVQNRNVYNRTPMQARHLNNDPRNPPRTPQRNPRTRTPVQSIGNRNIRRSPQQMTVIGDVQNRNAYNHTLPQRKVRQPMRTPEELAERFNHDTRHLISPYPHNRHFPYSRDNPWQRSRLTSPKEDAPYYSPQRGVWDIPQQKQKRNGIVEDAIEFIMNLICFFPLSLYNTMLVQYSPRDACKVLCVLFFIIAFVCFVISWDLTTGGIIWMACGVIAAILGSDELNI